MIEAYNNYSFVESFAVSYTFARNIFGVDLTFISDIDAWPDFRSLKHEKSPTDGHSS